jgi:hypothetical protein
VPIKVVSERLGHSHPAFTMHTYQHLLPGMSAAAAEQFAALIADPSRYTSTGITGAKPRPEACRQQESGLLNGQAMLQVRRRSVQRSCSASATMMPLGPRR